MNRYVCTIQEGQRADRERAALAEGLTKIGQDCFGDDPSETEIEWNVVKKGFGWTAGVPSTSSLVLRGVPEGLPLPEREAYMRRVCDLWQAVTDCGIDEIVVTAWDGPLPG